MKPPVSRQPAARAGVAICFFGIPRSLAYTRPSIVANIIDPTRQLADVRVFAHFFDQNEISNPRSGEIGILDTDGLVVDDQETVIEQPMLCLSAWGFDELKSHGDAWDDGFASLRNLVHQLHSLRQVHLIASRMRPEAFVFARPDLWYFDNLGPVVRRALEGPGNCAYIPSWQPFGGQNDRFAVVRGEVAAGLYARRIEVAKEFCMTQRRALHSEALLGYALGTMPVRHIPHRAARVRVNGRVQPESFVPGWVRKLHRRVSSSGFHPKVRRVLHKIVNLLGDLDDIRLQRRPLPKTESGNLRIGFLDLQG